MHLPFTHALPDKFPAFISDLRAYSAGSAVLVSLGGGPGGVYLVARRFLILEVSFAVVCDPEKENRAQRGAKPVGVEYLPTTRPW